MTTPVDCVQCVLYMYMLVNVHHFVNLTYIVPFTLVLLLLLSLRLHFDLYDKGNYKKQTIISINSLSEMLSINSMLLSTFIVLISRLFFRSPLLLLFIFSFACRWRTWRDLLMPRYMLCILNSYPSSGTHAFYLLLYIYVCVCVSVCVYICFASMNTCTC